MIGKAIVLLGPHGNGSKLPQCNLQLISITAKAKSKKKKITRSVLGDKPIILVTG